MNYQKIYVSLIHKRTVQEILNKKNCYCEKHHIVPRSEGGNDDQSNLVNLTFREHFIAHMLLAKIYDDYKMYSAIIYMKARSDFHVNSHVYENIRKKFGQKFKHEYENGKIYRPKGKNHFNFGKSPKDRLTPEKYKQWRENISKSLKRHHPFKGKHHSKETIEKLCKPKTDLAKLHMKQSHYDCRGKNNPMYGIDFQTYMTDEAIKQRKVNCRNARLGKSYINNGTEMKMWLRTEQPPDGWKFGKIKKTCH